MIRTAKFSIQLFVDSTHFGSHVFDTNYQHCVGLPVQLRQTRAQNILKQAPVRLTAHV